MSVFKRGRILRDTHAGDGLVSIDGNQYPFRLEGMWRSDFAPKINGPVEGEFDDQGNLVALRGLDASTLAGEQATQALGVAQDAAKKFAQDFQSQGLPVIQRYAQRIGYLTLAGFTAVVIGWFFLPFLSADIPFGGKISATFYETLKISNAAAGSSGLEGLANNFSRSGRFSGGSAGLFGLLCFLSLAAVFLPQVWRDRRATWGLLAPLATMLVAIVVVYWRVSSAASAGMEEMGGFGGEEFAEMAREMAREAMTEMRNAVSLGFGLWLSLAGAVLLAWLGFNSTRSTAQA